MLAPLLIASVTGTTAATTGAGSSDSWLAHQGHRWPASGGSGPRSSSSSASWRERVLALNSTTPWLMTVRCQPHCCGFQYRL